MRRALKSRGHLPPAGKWNQTHRYAPANQSELARKAAVSHEVGNLMRGDHDPAADGFRAKHQPQHPLVHNGGNRLVTSLNHGEWNYSLNYHPLSIAERC